MDTQETDRLHRAIAKAPRETRRKVEALVEQAEAAYAALRAATAAEAEEFGTFQGKERDLFRRHAVTKSQPFDGAPVYTDQATGRRNYDSTDFDADVAKVMAAWEKLSRRRATVARATAAWADYAFLSDIAKWAESGVRFRRAELPKVKEGKHVAAVETLRAKIADLDARRVALEDMPPTVDAMIAESHRHVDEVAGQSAVPFYASRGTPPFDLTMPNRVVPGGGFATMPAEVLVWLLADEIKAALAAKIRAAAPEIGGMPDAERDAGLAAIDADRLRIEREEEAHIVAASEIGQTIPRRRAADPRAILEVE